MVNTKTTNKNKSFMAVVFMLCSLMFIPELAHAAGGDPISRGLNWAVELLTTGLARSAAILSIAVLGYMAWAGHLTGRIVGFAILGIVFVFGGASIVDLIIAAVR
ncbi:TrbC/VirB2 family protein [Xenorhabdus sp. KK7.4]|uniref:TrbC/VirB2 family protein n=1 Tax=Xenorhabdus sp. KK7.4 TaxID=1851572 RepID=UPI000C0567B3|nr:TrbC/VirB2 family protein [Xenorhabdus sp. KK7.4]PHM51281.1 hypothetical protein Xekk_03854 [Xenorhabdus sp. KK7.4]